MSNRQHKSLQRLLRALTRPRARLRKRAGGYTVEMDEAGAVGVVLKPEAALVDMCLREGLLRADGADGWRLAATGRMALKRLLAGAEPFAAQHREPRRDTRPDEDGDAQPVTVSDAASPLAWLARRKDASGAAMIDRTQLAAGERLARDFSFAGMQPRITANWDPTSGGGGGRKHGGVKSAEITDERMAARQRVRKAVEAVGGDLADILLDICCFEIGLTQAESRRNWPRRSGKIILQIALDRLAGHYGMKVTRRAPPIHRRLEHWGADDYRPSIEGG